MGSDNTGGDVHAQSLDASVCLKWLCYHCSVSLCVWNKSDILFYGVLWKESYWFETWFEVCGRPPEMGIRAKARKVGVRRWGVGTEPLQLILTPDVIFSVLESMLAFLFYKEQTHCAACELIHSHLFNIYYPVSSVWFPMVGNGELENSKKVVLKKLPALFHPFAPKNSFPGELRQSFLELCLLKFRVLTFLFVRHKFLEITNSRRSWLLQPKPTPFLTPSVHHVQ